MGDVQTGGYNAANTIGTYGDGNGGNGYGGSTNTDYQAPNLNIQSIPNLNTNPFKDPTGAAPNFNGTVTVDTASLAAFGEWVANELTEPLKKLTPQLQSIAVEPGAFYWADYIRSYVNGTGPTSGLKNQFITVVEDLLNGLSGISDGVNQLVKQYANAEALNSAQATKLENDLSSSFSTASSSFSALGTAGQSSGSSGGGSGKS